MSSLPRILTSACALLLTVYWFAPTAVFAKAPTPDLENFQYGPHERNVLDLWKAKSDAPTPLLAFYHGGGFDHGDKTNISGELVRTMLADGISVMAVNYRLTPQAKYPEHYLDCARAIQTARAHSGDWNIDPRRIAATGTSAGGVVSLWLAFHDDLADAESDDPVLRESTRLRCAIVINTPVTLDPRDIKKIFGETALGHRFFKGEFFGMTPEEAKSAEGLKLFAEASPLAYVSADDPPVFAFHHGPKALSPDLSVNDAVHHYAFGAYLKERMEELGLECELLSVSDVTNGESGMDAFLKRHLVEAER